jgi:hypothetical protein
MNLIVSAEWKEKQNKWCYFTINKVRIHISKHQSNHKRKGEKKNRKATTSQKNVSNRTQIIEDKY